MAPRILNLNIRLRCVINFTSSTLLPGKDLRYPLSMRQSGLQSRSGKEKISSPLESNHDSWVIQPVAWSLYRLRYPDCFYFRLYIHHYIKKVQMIMTFPFGPKFFLSTLIWLSIVTDVCNSENAVVC
jgi:hypothetical protein